MPGFISPDSPSDAYLTGRFLIAMPGMPDDRFSKTLIYMCAHGPEGAMGLVVNKPLETISFPDLLEQLDITVPPAGEGIEVLFGGPVETGRGFVLHSPDYMHDATMVVDESVALTATVDILRAIADGDGPMRSLLALGYAGWAPGQLEEEMAANSWLSCPASEEIVFDLMTDDKYERVLEMMGVKPAMLSMQAGHA